MSSRALVAVVLLLWLPGLGALVALFRPGNLDLVTQTAVVLALGYGVTAAIAFALAATDLLEPASFLAALTAATAGLWFLGARRSSPRRWLKQAAQDFRADPLALGTGFGVILAIVLVRLTVSPLLNFYASSPFRYWADGVEIATGGGIPELAIHWGSGYPPTISKSFFNSFNAGAAFVLGDDPLVALGALLWIVSVGLAIAFWSLGRELGLRLTAPLLPLLLLASSLVFQFELTRDLEALKAELLGRLVALGGLALAISALRERRGGGELLAPGLLFGAAAATHLASSVVFGAMLALYAFSLLLRDGGAGRILARVGAIAVVGVVVVSGVFLLARGDAGLQGLTGREPYDPVYGTFDPTAKFAFDRLSTWGGAPGPWYAPPSELVRMYLAESFGIPRTDKRSPPLYFLGGAFVALGVALALAGRAVRWPADLKPLTLVAPGMVVVLLCASLSFSYRFQTFVPAMTGARRVVDYGAIPVVLLALVLLELAIRALRRFGPRVPALAAGALAVALAAVLLPRVPPPAEGLRAATGTVRALVWIRSNTPCRARIVANRPTEGIFEAMTGRVGVLEGMAPYFRPRMLEQVLALQDEAQAFLADPLLNVDFLTKRDIDFVVLAGAIPFENARVIPSAPLSQFARLPALELAYSASGVDIFRVGARRVDAEMIDRTDVSPLQCR